MNLKLETGNLKPRIAVHKFASCDGCQLAFLNLGEELLTLAGRVEIVHFAEAGPVQPEVPVDIAFVEGSITTPGDLERIQQVRKHARYLVTLGACATTGGLQALRNLVSVQEWLAAVYARPEYIASLETSTAIARHVKVDLELWGCPVSGRQLVAALGALLEGVAPRAERDKVCLECKRAQNVCVLVAGGIPCMGPVTRTGCGAICPRFGRDCYGCTGPAENANTDALARRFQGLGLLPGQVVQRFLSINGAAPEFADAAQRARR